MRNDKKSKRNNEPSNQFTETCSPNHDILRAPETSSISFFWCLSKYYANFSSSYENKRGLQNDGNKRNKATSRWKWKEFLCCRCLTSEGGATSANLIMVMCVPIYILRASISIPLTDCFVVGWMLRENGMLWARWSGLIAGADVGRIVDKWRRLFWTFPSNHRKFEVFSKSNLSSILRSF